VGTRLALAAEGLVYGRTNLCMSPQFREYKVEGSKIRLSFDYAQGGLLIRSTGAANSFAICGKDRVWHWAAAKIDKDGIVVWSDEISDPKAVRYAWANNPVMTIYNEAGLPLLPFRTDDFEQ